MSLPDDIETRGRMTEDGFLLENEDATRLLGVFRALGRYGHAKAAVQHLPYGGTEAHRDLERAEAALQRLASAIDLDLPFVLDDVLRKLPLR